MNIFAIGDLHLSLFKPKEMDVFGSHWANHFERISEDWNARVSEGDVVLIPGDISWAMRLEEAVPDLEAIGALPGKKIMLRGNHDFWWGSMAKVNSILCGDSHIVQNNSLVVGDYVFCGTRGWTLPLESGLSEEDKKIYEREKLRLVLSLDSAKRHEGKTIIVMTHFPPIYEKYLHTEISDILSDYGVSEVVFGHLHGEVLRQTRLTDIKVGNVNYNLVSADYMDFRLKQIV